MTKALAHTAKIKRFSLRSFPGYAVDREGNVWSRWTLGRNSRQHHSKWRKLKPGKTRTGYLYVSLYQGSKKQSVKIHTLMLTTFVGPKPPRMECRHLDGKKTNNRAKNLVWGTPTENAKDKARHGTVAFLKGTLNGNSKVTEADVKLIRRMKSAGYTLAQIVERVGKIKKSMVSYICRKQAWRHI